MRAFHSLKKLSWLQFSSPRNLQKVCVRYLWNTLYDTKFKYNEIMGVFLTATHFIWRGYSEYRLKIWGVREKKNPQEKSLFLSKVYWKVTYDIQCTPIQLGVRRSGFIFTKDLQSPRQLYGQRVFGCSNWNKAKKTHFHKTTSDWRTCSGLSIFVVSWPLQFHENVEYRLKNR